MTYALILAEGKLKTSDAKTAHGLLRKSLRWHIVGVIDSENAGLDAADVVPGIKRGVKIYASLEQALAEHPEVTSLIVGVATSGGRLPPGYRGIIKEALKRGLKVISGLHEFLSDDEEFREIAERSGAEIVDVRKIFRDMRVFYSGKIKEVKARKIVVLGTDACIGKRTVAWMIVDELNRRGVKAVFVGTGQTAWMQGARYGIVLDAMINDFVTGGLEHEIWRAYVNERPDFIVVPGQGSLLHPVFPGSYEIVNLLSPDAVVLQHAPGRKHLEDFPEYPMPSLEKYVTLIELITGKKPLAITLNTENLSDAEAREWARRIESRFGVVSCVPLIDGVSRVVDELLRLGEK